VDTVNNVISAQLNHFSLYQIMGAGGAGDGSLAAVRYFPNPVRPHMGLTHARLTLTNLPQDAVIRIHNVSGRLVRTLRSDGAGTAEWDTRNERGENVASGVYFIRIESSSAGRRTIRVAVER
ncbi:MAG: T9SS type A sorting domain-containing protein, partial [Elusimicrobia bacterium]|nr:T9SS type A sorting domain-containing protein [Elusimicrobiota bacterium]